MPNYKITQTKLNRMAKDLLETAEAYGLTDNYLFMTTFRRYTTQVALAEELQKSLEKDGVVVTMEYF